MGSLAVPDAALNVSFDGFQATLFIPTYNTLEVVNMSVLIWPTIENLAPDKFLIIENCTKQWWYKAHENCNAKSTRVEALLKLLNETEKQGKRQASCSVISGKFGYNPIHTYIDRQLAYK